MTVVHRIVGTDGGFFGPRTDASASHSVSSSRRASVVVDWGVRVGKGVGRAGTGEGVGTVVGVVVVVVVVVVA